VPAAGRAMWSTITVAMTREEIEATARELTGRQVDDVCYYTLPYGMTDRPAWDRDVAHAVDYGIDLITSGGTMGITWSQHGQFGYGLHLVPRSPPDRAVPRRVLLRRR
jgi:hypothetical protein